MIPEERRRQLLAFVTLNGAADISTLADRLNVSQMTIRRDIAMLEELGSVVSVPGGVTIPSRLLADGTKSEKLRLSPNIKKAIGQASVSYINPGDTIFLDAGTTCLAVAEEIVNSPDLKALKVATNDLNVAQVFAQQAQNAPDMASQVFMLGGALDLRNLATEGTYAADALLNFNFDVAFVSTSSFDLRGLSVPNESKAIVKRRIHEASKKTILVSDSSKYGKVSSHNALKLKSFDVVITDSGIPENVTSWMQDAAIQLVLANENTESRGT